VSFKFDKRNNFFTFLLDVGRKSPDVQRIFCRMCTQEDVFGNSF